LLWEDSEGEQLGPTNFYGVFLFVWSADSTQFDN